MITIYQVSTFIPVIMSKGCMALVALLHKSNVFSTYY